jgi:hypothetical protein
MTEILIYDLTGNIINNVKINDIISYVSGRVHKGKNVYYKGLGVPYKNHYVYNITSSKEYSTIKKSEIFYVGNLVAKKCFENKTGIFQERYQPFFPDFIGSCGIKEGTIGLNSIIFEKSSVEVIDCVEYDSENQQFYYVLNYKCNRKNFLNNDSDPHKLKELLDFMLLSDWNFLWDKSAINDVSADGRVSDVADLFVSSDIKHKLGTVYSILYSMGKLNFSKYLEFLDSCNLKHEDERSFVFNAIKILEHNKVNVSELFIKNSINKNYKNIVLNYLIAGKNCAYCACNLYQDNGDKVAKKYKEIVSEQLKNL